MKKIEIEVPARQKGFSQGTTISIDGRQLQDVRQVEIVIEAGQLTKLIITKYLREEDGSYTLQSDDEGNEGLVNLIQEFSFSGSFSLNGVLLNEEVQVL